MTAAVVLLALLAAQQPDAPLAEARRLINAGEPARAIERLKTITTDQDPALQLQVALLLGVAHYQSDDPAKAVEVLTPIVDRLPRDSIERREAEQVLGLAAVVVGRYA